MKKLTNLGPVRELILKILREKGPMIDEKLVGYFLQEANSGPSHIRSSRKDLVRKGLVKEEGSLAKGVSGRYSIVWKAVNNEQTNPNKTQEETHPTEDAMLQVCEDETSQNLE